AAPRAGRRGHLRGSPGDVPRLVPARTGSHSRLHAEGLLRVAAPSPPALSLVLEPRELALSPGPGSRPQVVRRDGPRRLALARPDREACSRARAVAGVVRDGADS